VSAAQSNSSLFSTSTWKQKTESCDREFTLLAKLRPRNEECSDEIVVDEFVIYFMVAQQGLLVDLYRPALRACYAGCIVDVPIYSAVNGN